MESARRQFASDLCQHNQITVRSMKSMFIRSLLVGHLFGYLAPTNRNPLDDANRYSLELGHTWASDFKNDIAS